MRYEYAGLLRVEIQGVGDVIFGTKMK